MSRLRRFLPAIGSWPDRCLRFSYSNSYLFALCPSCTAPGHWTATRQITPLVAAQRA